jgi:hypothetical protein
VQQQWIKKKKEIQHRVIVKLQIKWFPISIPDKAGKLKKYKKVMKSLLQTSGRLSST